jgi:hypothetical protein
VWVGELWMDGKLHEQYPDHVEAIHHEDNILRFESMFIP